MHVTNYVRGMYTFRSDSTMVSFGFLYDGTFNPLSPMDNLVDSEGSSTGSSQFLIAHYLETNVMYTLVYTTLDERLLVII